MLASGVVDLFYYVPNVSRMQWETCSTLKALWTFTISSDKATFMFHKLNFRVSGKVCAIFKIGE